MKHFAKTIVLSLGLLTAGCMSGTKGMHTVQILNEAGQPFPNQEIALTSLQVHRFGRPDSESRTYTTNSHGIARVPIQADENIVLSVAGGVISFSEISEQPGVARDLYRSFEQTQSKTGLRIVLIE